MRKLIIITLITMFLSSCNKNGNGELEQKIKAKITETCKDENCNIDLSKITSFKWNKFYVFKETTTLEEIEKTLNQKYPYFTDIARRLIFIDKNNKIIYHEDIFPNVEGMQNNEVCFYIPDTVNFKFYTNPIFTVSIAKTERGKYYVLNQ